MTVAAAAVAAASITAAAAVVHVVAAAAAAEPVQMTATTTMAAATTLPDCLKEEFLHCRLCKDDFDTPKILPCLHSFCCGCLETHIKRSTTSAASLWFLCPQCRAITDLPPSGPSAFKTNQFVANLKRFVDVQTDRYQRLVSTDSGDEENQQKSPENANVVCCDVSNSNGRRDVVGGTGNGCMCGRGDVSFYCEDCELLSCPQCVTSRHKTHSVSMLEDKANKERDRFINTAHRSRKEVVKLNSGISDMEKYKIQLRTSRNEAAAGVREQAARLRKLIDREEDILLKSIDEVFESETSKTDKVIKENRNVTVILKNLTDFSGKLLKEGTSGQVVAWSVHAESQLRGISNHGRKYGVERIQRNPVQIQFSLNSEINEEAMVKKLVGEVHYGVNVNIVDCNMNKDNDLNQSQDDYLETTLLDYDEQIMKSRVHSGQLVRSFSAFTDGSHFSPTIVGLAVTLKGDVLVVDKNNKCVKFFGPQGGMFKKIHGSDNLWGVTVLQDGNYAITDKTVHMFDPRGRLVKVLRQQPRDSHGITINSNGDIIVSDCMSRCIYVLSVVGGSIKRIITQRGREPFKCPANLCVNSRDHLIVSDCGAHCIAIFNDKGQLMNQYGTLGQPGAGPNQLDCPSGVCTDKLGNIVVCDKMNDRVVLLNSEGCFICVLLQGVDTVLRPQAVAVDTHGHLVVAEEEGKIKVFKYREVM